MFFITASFMKHPASFLSLVTLLAGLSGCAHRFQVSSPAQMERLTLSNGTLEVELTPAIGRMTRLAPAGGDNLLRRNTALEGILTRPPDDPWAWNNHGGDWLWPVPQSEWHRLGVYGHNWPPPVLFDGPAWTAEELSIQGAPAIRLGLDVGDPLHIRIERVFRFCPDHPAQLRIEQRILRTAPSDIPVTLWQVGQFTVPRAVVLEVPGDTAFEEGWTPIGSTDFDEASLKRTHLGLVWDPAKTGRGKFGNDGREMTAVFSTHALHLQSEGGSEGGLLPDGGCSQAIYKANDPLYVELETMSVARALQPGGTLENTVIYTLIHPNESNLYPRTDP